MKKNQKGDSGSPDRPTNGELTPGYLGADVKMPELLFTKKDNSGKALKGANFTVYKSNTKEEKLEVAKNKDGILLENLITNEMGKLCKDNKLVKMTLDAGYYLFTENAAPEGYEILKKDTLVAISIKQAELTIVNNSNGKATEEPTPTETNAKPQESNKIQPTESIRTVNTPQTGDNTQMVLYTVLLLLSFMLIVSLVYRTKRQ